MEIGTAMFYHDVTGEINYDHWEMGIWLIWPARNGRGCHRVSSTSSPAGFLVPRPPSSTMISQATGLTTIITNRPGAIKPVFIKGDLDGGHKVSNLFWLERRNPWRSWLMKTRFWKSWSTSYSAGDPLALKKMYWCAMDVERAHHLDTQRLTDKILRRDTPLRFTHVMFMRRKHTSLCASIWVPKNWPTMSPSHCIISSPLVI